jgi:hypothetical protein
MTLTATGAQKNKYVKKQAPQIHVQQQINYPKIKNNTTVTYLKYKIRFLELLL